MKLKTKIIDNYNRKLAFSESKNARSYRILFDGLEPSEFNTRFEHEPQVTLIVELRALHENRFLYFDISDHPGILKDWIKNINKGDVDFYFNEINKDLLVDPESIKRIPSLM